MTGCVAAAGDGGGGIERMTSDAEVWGGRGSASRPQTGRRGAGRL